MVQHLTRKKVSCPPRRIKNNLITCRKEHKLLGIVFESPRLNWKKHIEYLITVSRTRLSIPYEDYLLNCKGSIISNIKDVLYIIYKIKVRLCRSMIYSSAWDKLKEKLEVRQNIALRSMLGARNTTPMLSIQAESGLPPLNLRRGYLSHREYIKIKNNFQ